jgi:hypothetical protein
MHDWHDEREHPPLYLRAVAQRIDIFMVCLQRASYLNATIYLDTSRLSQRGSRSKPNRGEHDIRLYNFPAGEGYAQAFMNTLHASGCSSQVKNHSGGFQLALHEGASRLGQKPAQRLRTDVDHPYVVTGADQIVGELAADQARAQDCDIFFPFQVATQPLVIIKIID